MTVTVPLAIVNGTGAPPKANPPTEIPGAKNPAPGNTVLVPGAIARRVRLKRSMVKPAGIGAGPNGRPREVIPTPSLEAAKPGVTGKGMGVKGRPGTTGAPENASMARIGAMPAMLPAVGNPVGGAKPSTAPASLKSAAKAKKSNNATPSLVKTTSIVKDDPGVMDKVSCMPAVPESRSIEITGIAVAVVVAPNRMNAAARPRIMVLFQILHVIPCLRLIFL